MKSRRTPRKPCSADAIARRAGQGKDVTRFFTNTGRMMSPVQEGNVPHNTCISRLDETQAACKQVLRWKP